MSDDHSEPLMPKRTSIYLRNLLHLACGKSSIFTLELSQKSDFQPSTTKPDNIGHPTIKTGQIWPLSGFKGGFAFSKKINKSN